MADCPAWLGMECCEQFLVDSAIHHHMARIVSMMLLISLFQSIVHTSVLEGKTRTPYRYLVIRPVRILRTNRSGADDELAECKEARMYDIPIGGSATQIAQWSEYFFRGLGLTPQLMSYQYTIALKLILITHLC